MILFYDYPPRSRETLSLVEGLKVTHAGKARADRRKTKDGSILRIHSGSRGTGAGEPGKDPSYGVRRVRTRGRGACLKRPAREEATSIKQPTAKTQKPSGHLAHPAPPRNGRHPGGSNKEKEKSEKKQQGRPSIGAPPAKKRVLSSTKKETKGASQAASQSEKFMLEIIHGDAGAKAKEPRKPLKLQIEQDQSPLASAPRTPIGLNCEREEDEGKAISKIPKQSSKFKLKGLLNELNEEVRDLQKITGIEYPTNVELAEKVATILSLVSNIKTDDFTRRADGRGEGHGCSKAEESHFGGDGEHCQRVVSNRKLTVRDLDQTITEHEIKEAVNAAVGSPDRSTEAIQVSGLKKPQGGMAGMATLHLSDTDADKLLERGKIRIGWNQCRVQEIVGPVKCFQCLQFGHIVSRCAAERKLAAGTCFRCGERRAIWQEIVKTILGTSHEVSAVRSRAVHRLADQLARERGTSLVDDSEDAAIMLRGTPMRKWGKGRGFVWAQVTSCTVFSCYISPNITTGEYERHLDDLASCVRTQGGPGGMLANWAAAMNLVAMNRGEPTFERGGSRSVLDVTFCSPDIARRIQGWHVMEAGMTTSDHLPIEFTIRASHSLLEVGRPARGWRWTDSKKDELAALLRRKLEHLSSARLSLRSPEGETPSDTDRAIYNVCPIDFEEDVSAFDSDHFRVSYHSSPDPTPSKVFLQFSFNHSATVVVQTEAGCRPTLNYPLS
ncbi:hypothetical protein GEV33_004005 [Tenebrio molitor]|uniref:CCHC-type domain-containing protein n=1 Tax=Tenebrio molitor TaxID=7067 RepID=A0A8J6HRQ8_TENMO|nr:hypothetical protein GEV33_004005 [Tenebrio molitor]